jgi:hypothetical protein
MRTPCSRDRGLRTIGAAALLGLAAALALPTPAAAQQNGPRSPRFRGSVPPNRNLLPRFRQALTLAGPNQVTVKNPFHFRVWVQLRCGERAVEFRLEGKAKKVLQVPNGEYSFYYRGEFDRKCEEGSSFNAQDGVVRYDGDTGIARKDVRRADVRSNGQLRPRDKSK